MMRRNLGCIGRLRWRIWGEWFSCLSTDLCILFVIFGCTYMNYFSFHFIMFYLCKSLQSPHHVVKAENE